ncbi:MAG: 16S rRNA pseudouridine(516) synthase RsuA [Pseudomonadota bacterium]
MRIDKFIGNNSSLSRSLIHVAIKRGQVTLNGDVINKTNTTMNVADTITLNGEIITATQTRYIMLHKPTGYVCANTDSEHPTVLDLIDIPQKETLQIAGRLDLDTTGLVLLTDDGQWNHLLTSPKKACYKSYLVTTTNAISATTADSFTEGVLLHGETKLTLPAKLTLISSHEARLEIQEGKYHQVKRMFAAVGNNVATLHRERIGNILLDTQLAPGEYRHLTEIEISSFR